MKVKYTQSARDADVDTDFALAMALEEDGADSDDDFQAIGASPAFLKQTLALRSCAMKKHVSKKVPRKNLRLEKKQRGGGGGDAAHLEDRAGRGKGMTVRCDAMTAFVLDSTATSIDSEDTASKDRERRCKEPKEIDKRVLKDRNLKCTGRAEMESVVNNAVVLASGDENGNNVRSVKLKKFSLLRTPGIEENDRHESTDWCIDSSLACDQSELQGQSVKFDSKRKTESGIHDTGWSLRSDAAKKVKTIAGVPDDTDIQRSEQTKRNAGLEGVEIDLGAEVDEDMIICTQVEEPIELELGESAGSVVDLGKKTAEDRPKRKHNIYDILLGNNRSDRDSSYVPNSTVDKGVGCDGDVEEMEIPGTAMRALVDEAELDYEGLDFDEEENESMDSFECPVCGIVLVDLSVSDREQHVGDCLEKDNVPYGRKNPGDGLGREADNTEPTESVQQLSSRRIVTIGSLDCPVCGVCIEELSTAQREEHTNACLEQDNPPCVRTNSGDYLGCQPESTETAGISQLLTSQRNMITETLCPICGDCIEELSTAQREEHTNACLDNAKGESPGEVAEPAGSEVAEARGRPDVGPVVTWLTNLNLEKYVDIFVREEIDLGTLKWLTEEDLSSLGITAFGPRRKIACAIQELRKPAPTAQQIAAMQEGQRLSDAVVISSINKLQGPQKSIADFFIPPPNTGPRVPAPDRNALAVLKAPGSTSTPVVSARNRGQRCPIPAFGNLRSAGTHNIPPWMCIPGTSFRVDAFKYTTGNCSNWFLTHFHSDHYQGLTRGFRHGKIFCSSITARLVKLRIGVPSDRIQALPLNETVLIDGIRVTFIDANHCPGSVMILFEPPNGKAVLHTGDFRFCSDMACNEVLKACRISTLILDTTYCDPQYDFPKQDTVIQFVIDAIQAEAFNTKTLFLIGTYTIGKERIFLEVGKVLQKYVYVGAAKKRLLDCMDLAEEDKRWLTTKDQESHIHAVPLWSVASFKRMGSISRHYHGRYNSIVSFSPTGWSFGKDKKRMQGRPGRRYQQGSIIRYEVPYSEHSSFSELKEFVRTIASEKIIPSVIGRAGWTADAMVASLLREES